ncbi:MFS transporter [Puia sp. P3]|uniref:MFS transporter n=1 Tax=Puia sp. P3 TaxID=3423952 RepID=UPI003D67D234
MGIGVAFVLYGVSMVPAIFFVRSTVPETKGRTLEEIERQWTKGEHKMINDRL